MARASDLSRRIGVSKVFPDFDGPSRLDYDPCMGNLRVKSNQAHELVANTQKTGRYHQPRMVTTPEGQRHPVYMTQDAANVYDRLFTQQVPMGVSSGALDLRDKVEAALAEIREKAPGWAGAAVEWAKQGQVEAAQNSWGGLGRKAK